jgi:phosphoglycolate phosphatase-like HAD superfamily hydrolase
MGGDAQDPQAYKDEYHRRLLERIDHRLKGLRDGTLDPVDYMVPGAEELLQMLKRRGVSMYLASGTDEVYMAEEARLLGLSPYFDGHVYGAQRDYKTFSKKMVIDRIIRENNLAGECLIGFGDGYVEIENVKSVGGFACGVASNEAERAGIDEWKRDRLIGVGADIIIADYRCLNELEEYLFG